MIRQFAKISLYWKCQLLGWTLASAYWLISGWLEGPFNLALALALFVGDLIIYILPTDIFRSISLKYKWEKWEPKKLLRLIIPAIFILGSIFMILAFGKNYIIKHYIWNIESQSFVNIVRNNWLGVWITGIRLAAIWILAYYLYHYALAQINAAKETARLSILAKNAQLENLKSQLNPHFFFNSLNTIKALISEDPNQAKRAIEVLADLLRTSLKWDEYEWINLEDELELIEDYLELEKLRFEDQLETSIQIPTSSLKLKILPLSIHTLVENAIKHGISKLENGGRFELKAEVQPNQLIIEVINDGILASNKKGTGLKNLSERLQLQYSGQASVELRDLPSNKVLAILILPIK